MNRVLLPGLLVYFLLSGLGLFLGSGLSSPFFIPFLAGVVFLFFTALYFSFFSTEQVPRFLYIGLAIIGLNLLIQLTGGSGSPFSPAYFLLTAIAVAFISPLHAYASSAAILIIEAGNVLASRPVPLGQWLTYGGFAFSLAGATVVAIPLARRIRKEAHRARTQYEKLLADAESVDPLAAGQQLAAVTKENRRATNVSAAVEREGAFTGLIDIISGMVPAHTYAVFLADRQEGRFFMRAIRSKSSSIPAVGTVEVARGKGLIGICADKNEPQYLPDLVIPARSLGYYTQDVPIRSFLAIPIAHGERNTGVLVVDSLEDDAFPAATQDVLARLAPFFSQIVDKTQMTQELDIRAKNFAALHTMSEVLSSSLEIDEVLKNIAGQIRSVVSSDFSAFLLYDEKTGEVVLNALHGYESRFEGNRFPLEESVILSHMFKQWRDRSTYGQYYFSDLGGRGRDIGLFPMKELRRPLQSLYCRPLVAREKFIGAFLLGSLQPNALTEYELHFVDTLMNQVSLVIDNTILHQDIRDMARTDGLTGLLNHRTFMEKLKEEFVRIGREPRPFSLLLADIDYFKKINDAHGHPVGDVALKQIGDILKDAARGADFAARYGGEEFAVGMVDTDLRGAEQMAERVRQIVEKTVVIAGKIQIRLTVSVGIASFPEDTRIMESLMGMADKALYQAKHAGRNRVCLYEDVQSEDVTSVRAGSGR